MTLCRRCGRAALTLVLLLVAVVSTQAEELIKSEDTEREVLARVLLELQLVESLTLKASQRKPTGTRVSFDYSLFLKELQAVEQGIAHYISGTRLQPRTFEPLKADYTTVKSQAAEGEGG